MNLNTIHNENVELQNMLVELEQKNKMMSDSYQQGSVDRNKF